MKHKIKLVSFLILFSLFAVNSINSVTDAHTFQPNLHLNLIDKQIKNIQWDNGMDYSSAILSQWDQVYPIEAWTADDFSFENDTYINGISWIGYYAFKSICQDGQFDMQITFFFDRGDGYAPGTVFTGPIFFYNSQINETYLEPYTYFYDVTFSEPILFAKNQIYWISIQAVAQMPPEWGICVNTGPILMHEAVYKCAFLGVPDWEDAYYQWGDHYNMCFQLFGDEKPPTPDLDCTGSLTWTDIKLGTTVNGSFQLMNIGEPHSHLNWIIASYPDWGTWTFTPTSDVNLTPEEGVIIVNVTVIAPDLKNQEFQGQITVVNTENSSDYCTIPVSLTTPLKQNIMHHRFFERFFDRFSYAFPIIRHLLGY